MSNRMYLFLPIDRFLRTRSRNLLMYLDPLVSLHFSSFELASFLPYSVPFLSYQSCLTFSSHSSHRFKETRFNRLFIYKAKYMPHPNIVRLPLPMLHVTDAIQVLQRMKALGHSLCMLVRNGCKGRQSYRLCRRNGPI